jgi:hypothetical protein
VSTRITVEDFGGDTPRSLCEKCEASWYIYWDRLIWHNGFRYCPFCGEEIVEFVEVEE